MRRSRPSSATPPPVIIKCLSEAKGDDYALYLLSDNSPEAQKQATNLIDHRNAILLFPESDPTLADSTGGSRRYFAKIFKKGESTAVVSMGKRNFIKNLPDANNLIKAALAFAGIVSVETTTPLLKTIRPVFPTFAPNVGYRSLASFASTSFFANHLANHQAELALDQKALLILFDSIRKGNIAKVKKMLDANPRLALVKWKAYNEEDRIITNMGGQRIDVEEKTGCQFALGEEDNEIAALFEEAILKVADEDEVKKQKRAQFPDDWEKKEAEKWQPIFAILNILKEVIRLAEPADIISSGDPDYTLTVNPNSDVAMALRRLQELLDARLNEPVTTGRHYNPKPLQHNIYETYDAHFKDYFGNRWDDPRAMLFWRLSGRLQQIMPANYVQAYCKPGLYQNVEQIKSGKPQGRSFTFEIYNTVTRQWVDTNFYPVGAHRLGDDFSIGCLRESSGHAGVASLPPRGGQFSELMSIKNSSRAELTQHHDLRDAPAKTKTSCSVM